MVCAVRVVGSERPLPHRHIVGAEVVSKSPAEVALALHIRSVGLPTPEHQYQFALPRKWAADFAWPAHRLLVEVEGFGHHKLNRYFGDIEKYNEMTMRGWYLLRFTTKMVDDGEAYQTLERYFGVDGQSEEVGDG